MNEKGKEGCWSSRPLLHISSSNITILSFYFFCVIKYLAGLMRGYLISV